MVCVSCSGLSFECCIGPLVSSIVVSNLHVFWVCSHGQGLDGMGGWVGLGVCSS